MPSTTANKIRGRIADWLIVDEVDKMQQPLSFKFASYDMRRESKKQYAFYYCNLQAGAGAIQRYHCSYPESQRRFKLWLITQRLLS